MTDADDVAAPDLQREADFCDGVSRGVAYVLKMMRGVAGETTRRSEAKALREFADALASESEKPEFYAVATARWLETSK